MPEPEQGTCAPDQPERARCGLRCQRPEPDGRLCEHRCEDLYLRDLTNLPTLYHRLGPDDEDQHLLPGSSHAPKVSGSKAPPLPARGPALNLRGPAAQRAISRYALEEAGRDTAHLDDQHGQRPIVDALASAITELRPALRSTYRLNRGSITDQIVAHTRWLERQYDRYKNHPETLNLAEDIRRAAHNAMEQLGDYDAPIDQKMVPCRCDYLTLVQYPGEDDVLCTNPDCRAVYYPRDYQALVTRWAEWAKGQTA